MGGRGRVVAGAGVVVVAVAIAAAWALTGDDAPAPEPTPTTVADRRAGPCADLDEEAVEDALGGPVTLAVASATSCTASRDGTLVSADIQETDADADAADLAAAERRSGPSADDLEAWPSEDVDGLGDGARWLADPVADGSAGELHVLVGTRLIRIAVSTPPGYRRPAATIAEAVAGPVTTGL